MFQCPRGRYPQLGLIIVLLVPHNTHRELGAGNELKPDGAQEAFVILSIIVLQVDLLLHGVQKLLVLPLVPVWDSCTAL